MRAMALVACPDCTAEVSPQAPACPHCGRPIAPPTVQSGDVVAALASLLLPGAGQLAQGRVLAGLALVLLTPLMWIVGLARATEHLIWAAAGPAVHVMAALDVRQYAGRTHKPWRERWDAFVKGYPTE